jgi:ssDNA-binding replication factor A large subunit
MYKIPLADLKQKILASNTITDTELEHRMKNKINELSGLISEEGAAHIIANELGVQLIEQKDKLKIKEIYAGMRNISTQAKVLRKYDVREFQKDDRTGKVCSLLIGDETGTTRLVLWNEQVDIAVNENDHILIKEAYVRDNRGNAEIHLGQKGHVDINPEGVSITVTTPSAPTFERKTIEKLEGSEQAEILGTVVQVFDPRFFEICPQCRKRAMNNTCEAHGEVTPELSYVMNLVVDDGSGTIRTVLWKEQTNQLLESSTQDLAAYKEDLSKFEDVKTDLLGEQFKLSGKVKMNDMFNRLEFSVQTIAKASPEEELTRLQNT